MGRLNLSRRDMGTGMTDEAVTEFSARVNMAAFREHSAAVGRSTREVVRGLRAEELDEVSDPGHVRRVLSDTHPYVGKTKGWLLIHVALRHPSRHLGQATLVRKIQGLGSSALHLSDTRAATFVLTRHLRPPTLAAICPCRPAPTCCGCDRHGG